MTKNRIASAAVVLLLVLSTSASRFVAANQNTVEAGTLLTTADASKALEQSSQPGRRFMDSDPTFCMWSADPKMSDSARKIAVNTHTQRAFEFAKKPAITTIVIEPVSGVGDEAFYQIYPKGQSPFIWVRKGSKVFSIRMLGTKTNSFSIEQDKAKELALAKVAVTKL
jgi:hypothetical protein